MNESSQISLENLNEISGFFLAEKIVDFKRLSGGSENTNLHISTDQKNYVLTICEHKSKEDASKLVELLNHLINNGFRTSKPIQAKNGQHIHVWKGKAVILKSFLPGSIYSPIPEEYYALIAKELASLHHVPIFTGVSKSFNYGIQSIENVRKFAPNQEFTFWMEQKMIYINKYLNQKLPKCIIHADLFDNNIIIDVNKGTATIMDFEEACYYYRAFDLGMTIIGSCSFDAQLDEERLHLLVSQYHNYNTLRKLEIESIQACAVYAALVTASWRYIQFNYVIPSLKLKNHYVEMMELADQIHKIPKAGFMKLMKI